MSLEIIDFHTHPFLKNTENMCFYQGTVTESDDFIADMERAGISRFAGTVLDKSDKSINGIVASNRLALELYEKWGDKYIPGIHIHPDHIEASEKEIAIARERGVRLIGELVPYMHDYRYNHPKMQELLSLLDGGDEVISLHSADPDVADMTRLAKNHKNKTFVFAHPGDLNRVPHHIEAMRECENIYLDLSGTGLFRYGVLKFLVDSVGAERILFGTDYPICNPGMYVNAVLFEKISDREKELILSGNAKRLLKI